jgi:hypothetical protein
MSNREFSDVVLRLVSGFARDHINTSMPAKVVSVDNFDRDQTVDVLPLINDSFNDGTNVEFPPIFDVPLILPSAGGGLLSFPVAVGDTVLLIFSQKSLDEWMESRSFGNVGFTPSDKRRYALNDAIAISGMYTKHTHLTPNPNDVELKFNGLHVVLEKAGDITLSNPTHSLKLKASGEVLHSSGAKLTAAGDFVTASGISLDNHVHPQGNDSAGNSQVNTGPGV